MPASPASPASPAPAPPPGPWPPYGWYPPQPPAPGPARWHGWLLIVVTVLSAAAVALSALTLFCGVDFTEDGYFGSSDMQGVEVSGSDACYGATGGSVPDSARRSPDEDDPVVAAGETVVLRYQVAGCDQPTVVELTVGNVHRQSTAPTEEFQRTPDNGTYLLVDVTVAVRGNYVWPDLYVFSALGPGNAIATPLWTESAIMGPSEPFSDDPTTVQLAFDVTADFDVIRFDDATPGSVSWRI
ncbi:hypothetical protein ACG83_27895 [Frankia sp. R43]|uniref:hypothetical protein n=1 Tax=Frankia sp. R43 TaxID=269536 RepID=UPI0006CA0B88|nr:hypothetical protein [Frankia sp. R43]KPM52247.1 hypothetical protein ACG83_27895 [Frankia sp. R43]